MKSNAKDQQELHLAGKVSILIELWECLYHDTCEMCGAKPSIRDLNTLRSRVEHEGLSFLTITLPEFDEDFTMSLKNSEIDSTFFRNFKKNGKIPAFLQGISSLVFDKTTGRIRDEHCFIAVKAIRQLTRCLKKLALDCTPQRVEKALKAYCSDEQDLRISIIDTDKKKFLSVSKVLWSSIFSDFKAWDLIPKHGPGMTADVKKQNQKYAFSVWHDRLEKDFPLLGNALPGLDPDVPEFRRIRAVPSAGEQPVEVITVPKTLKTPRLIAEEPACMMFVQQGLKAYLYDKLETWVTTAGHVNFTDQTVNQVLAIKSSIDGRFATLDLSSASDRVLYALAIRMFDSSPGLKRAIKSCRSTRAAIGDQVINLRKFASMGSALCFPVEAMYFYTICVIALLENRDLSVTHRNILRVSRDIYIYGDDIIVPTDEAPIVACYLQKYHCKVATAKSFWTGKFRESCGMDAYCGIQVTPVYIRRMPPCNMHDATEAISWVEMANQFLEYDYHRTFRYVRNLVEDKLNKRLPEVAPTCGGLGWNTGNIDCHRWNPYLQQAEVKTLVVSVPSKKDKIDGQPALLKCLLKLEARQSCSGEMRQGVPFTMDPRNHLTHTSRSDFVTLKNRWARPY